MDPLTTRPPVRRCRRRPAGRHPSPTARARLAAVLAAAAFASACSDQQTTRPIVYETVAAPRASPPVAPVAVTNVAEVSPRPAVPTVPPADPLRPGEYPLNPRNMAYLPTTWDGRPGRFLVDTGSTLNVVNRRIAATLPPAPTSHTSVGTAGAAVVDLALYLPPRARVGPFDLDRYGPVAGFDFAGMPRSGNTELLGVVGSCVLPDATLRLDFDRNRFSFAPATPPAAADDPATVAVPVAFDNRMRLPWVHMTVNGRPVTVAIDTGDDSDGSLAADVFDDVTRMRVLPGHKAFTAAGPGKEPTPIRQVASIAFAAGRPYHNILLGRGGPISRIGMRFLARNRSVTISLASGQLVILQRPPA